MITQLRGHHLLNLQFHLQRRESYDSFEFMMPSSLQWERILNYPYIQLVRELDYICSKCSLGNVEKNICTDIGGDKASAYDNRVAKRAKLQIGKIYSSVFLSDYLMSLENFDEFRKILRITHSF